MKKLIIGFICLIVIAITACIVLPFIFKDKIIVAAKAAANEQLNAKLNFESLDVSLLQNIKNFPDISLIVHQPSVIGINQFEGDTLVFMDKLILAMDIQSVFQSIKPMEIKGLEILDGHFHTIIDTAGISNWDIIKPSEKSKDAAKFSLNIDKIILKDIHVLHRDKFKDKTIEILNLNHQGSGNFSDNLVNYNSQTAIEDLSYFNGMIPYLKNVHLNNESDIQIDQIAKKYILTKNELKLNELDLILDGSVQLMDQDALNLNLNFNTTNNDFKHILSLIPTIYKNNFDKIKTKGSFDLKGNINGLYHSKTYPKMDITLNVNNAEFQYPDLPKKVSNIQINSTIKSPGGSLDNLAIDVSRFSLNLGADPFTGRLNLTNPMSNPSIDLMTKGKLNLADIKQFYPMPDVTQLNGLMNLDLQIKAKQSDIKTKNYQAILASGSANINALKYATKSNPQTVNITNVLLNFSPQFVDMPQCKGAIGKTDFDLTGRLENFIGYYLSKDEVMNGTINIVSTKVDMNELSGNETSKKSDYVMIPKNIDFNGTAKINELLYGKMNIKNVSGNMHIKDEAMFLDNVHAELLGGSAKLNAQYSTKGESKPRTTIKYDAMTFDIRQVFTYMESAKKIAPIMEYMTGSISSNSNLSMSLLPDMSPDLNTLNGDLSAAIPFAKIVNVPALKKVSEITKLGILNNLEASNIKATMSFENGKIILQPMNFKSNDMNIGLSGMQGLDKSIDYKMAVDLPFSKLGNATSVVNDLVKKFKLPFIGNINPETIRLNLNLKGFFDNPIVSLGAPEILSNGKPADAKTVAIDAVKKVGEDVKKQVMKSADSLKNVAISEAQKKAEELKKEGEKRLEEARQKAEAEVTKKKDDLLKELKKKLPW